MTIRVIQWATGNVGASSLRGIIQDPNLELVGVRVYSEAKDGLDAGDLCGLAPVGVAASRDGDALFDANADAVIYCGIEKDGLDPVVDDICRFLSSGTNVLSSSLTCMTYPQSVPSFYGDTVARISEACRQGGSTYYAGGINPGFAGDVLTVLCAAGCRNIESIEVSEMADDCSQVDEPLQMQQWLGFGLTPEEDREGEPLRLWAAEFWFSGVVKWIAHGLGVELDEVRQFRNTVLAEKSYDLPGFRVERGTVGAVHTGFHGVVDGKTRITVNEYLKVAPDVAPEFPPVRERWATVAAIGSGSRGIRRFSSSWRWRTRTGLRRLRIFTFAGQRLASAVPAVCAAPAGIEFESLSQNVRRPAVTEWRRSVAARAGR